jgi:hypothetical protein
VTTFTTNLRRASLSSDRGPGGTVRVTYIFRRERQEKGMPTIEWASPLQVLWGGEITACI